MNIFDLLTHEWKTQFSRPIVWISLLVFIAAIIYAGQSGKKNLDKRTKAINAHHLEIASAMTDWQNKLSRLEQEGKRSGIPAWFGSAMDVNFASSLPPSPLADFAIGQSDLLPSLGVVSLWNPDIRLFSKYEFDEPVALAMGGFDLSKASILILPLLLIVLVFNILSAEKDGKRLGLMLAQGANIRHFFWSRLIVRSSIVTGVFLITSLFLLFFQSDTYPIGSRLLSFLGWSSMVIIYAAFWVALIAVISSKNRSGQVNVTLLLLLWAGMCFVVPATLASLAETVYPTPSRLAYLAETREVENETELQETDVTNQFLMDHPETMINQTSQIPDYVRTAFLVTSTVDDATRPLLEEFETTAINREAMLAFLSYLSPSIISHNLFNDISGSSSQRHRRYMSQVRQYKKSYAKLVGPYVVAGKRLPVSELINMPEFKYQEEPINLLVKRNLGSMVFLFVLIAFLFGLTHKRLSFIKGPD